MAGHRIQVDWLLDNAIHCTNLGMDRVVALTIHDLLTQIRSNSANLIATQFRSNSHLNNQDCHISW